MGSDSADVTHPVASSTDTEGSIIQSGSNDAKGTSNADTPCTATTKAATPNPDWHLTFAIPDLKTFSISVHDAVRTGVVEGRARREIIQVLRTYMIAHTLQPTSEQYKTVCKALVTKYPKLRDDEERQDSFVSNLTVNFVYLHP